MVFCIFLVAEPVSTTDLNASFHESLFFDGELDC